MKLKNFKRYFFLILLSVTIEGCVTPTANSIVGGEYDKTKDQTDYFVLPYGSASIPGKWVKTRYNSVSGQQFFINNDSIEIAIAFNACNKYEFNQKGTLTGFNFVKAFYEWDSKYFVDSYGLERSIIEKDSINKFIISRIFGKLQKGRFDTYFLIGEKNKNASNFSITITDKWEEQKKVDFLKRLFLNSKEK